jgi:AraC-like DNA-binding protein
MRNIENWPKMGDAAKIQSQQNRPFIAKMSFNDIDELSGRMADWDNDWRQLDAGRADNRIEVLAGQNIVVQQVRLSHSIHQQGATPSQLMTFGFPYHPSQMAWNGKVFPCPAMFDFNNKNGYDAVSGRAFFGVTVSLSRGKFARIAEQLKLPATELYGDDLPRDLSDKNCDLAKFRQYLLALCQRLPNARTAKDQQFVLTELEEVLPVRLLTALAPPKVEICDQSLKGRQKGMRRAIEFIEQKCQDNPRILDLCVATDLSWRSLDRAFCEHFGIGPKRYLLNLRLTQVRRQLKSAPPDTKVVDIANDWGFWHIGDFAREYRNMFGELPSESLWR